jgi:hypothetical protein
MVSMTTKANNSEFPIIKKELNVSCCVDKYNNTLLMNIITIVKYEKVYHAFGMEESIM